jgi:nitrite reductase/ring-hydroxylating ferredoxin subunit
MLELIGVSRRDLAKSGRKVVRKKGKQILLILSGDRVFAIANRCPHEGYPLSEGTLGPGCVLTCDWHNWKFALPSGAALVGRDPVRAYPVEIRGDEIWLDLADLPVAQQRSRALAGLDAAIADDDRTRMAREIARLERAGDDARLAVRHAIAHVSERLEGGMTHAHAAAADWLTLGERASSPETRLAALLEPIGHLARDTLGAALSPYPRGKRRWDARAFVAAVEAEDEPLAQAYAQGALAGGLTYADLRPALTETALAHYADFGHSAIYVLKAGQLIEALGDPVAAPVLKALVRQQVFARREDRLPEFRSYAPALASWSDKHTAPASADDFIGLSTPAILKRLLASSGRPTGELFDALLGAAGWNLAHFDRSYDLAAGRVIADNVSWLDFTHALTFGNAVHRLCDERPDLWPAALLQLALFVGRNKAYVNAQQDLSAWRVDAPAAFLRREMDRLYDHGVPEPIVACHRLKVLFAVEDELSRAPDAPWTRQVLEGVNRYLNEPMKRHHGLRIARQARAFVASDG